MRKGGTTILNRFLDSGCFAASARNDDCLRTKMTCTLPAGGELLKYYAGDDEYCSCHCRGENLFAEDEVYNYERKERHKVDEVRDVGCGLGEL